MVDWEIVVTGMAAFIVVRDGVADFSEGCGKAVRASPAYHALMTTELELIRRLARSFPPRGLVEIGIGDDGAVLRAPSSRRTVVVTDMLLDGIHFDLRSISPELAGRKAIAVNLSDLAAMGSRPTAAFVSLAIPRQLPDRDGFLSTLYEGIGAMLSQYDCPLAGGDTNSWHGPFAINVCLTGQPFNENVFRRSSASAGDVLLVSGPLGGSLLSGRHLKFEPRLRLAEWLADSGMRVAVMDISDGLALDLHRLAEASGVGAVLDAGLIPIHHDVPADWCDDDRLNAALTDGEDFELLIAVVEDAVDQLVESARVAGFVLHRIGRVSDTMDISLRRGGRVEPLQAGGWQH